MSQTGKPPAHAAKTAAAPRTTLPDGNPVFRMLGLPRIRARLPSRNWLIFLSITGSLAGALIYDRRCRKQVQRKWCDLVSPLATESIPTTQLPRKVTVYLSAPPGDGLRVVREHFTQYVKPILVAAAYDWEMVEGWREGDLRAAVAERIRTTRKKSGEPSAEADDQEEDLVAAVRLRAGVRPADGLGGEIVIGRHTWKEYVRGVHEGWLGPRTRETPEREAAVRGLGVLETADSRLADEAPSDKREETLEEAARQPGVASTPTSGIGPPGVDSTTEHPPIATSPTEAKAQNPPTKKPDPPTPPYILPHQYPDHAPAPTMPTSLAPVEPVPFPHILGFLHTPLRLQRFLTRRYLADDIGAQVASVILATETRHWDSGSGPDHIAGLDGPDGSAASALEDRRHWEQQDVLRHEEDEWHSSARQPSKPDEATTERPLLEPMVIDDRIGGRMTRFAMTEDAMQRARDAAALMMAHQTPPETIYAGWWRAIKTLSGFDLADARGSGWKDGLVGSDGD